MLTEAERHWAINAKMRLSHKDDFHCGKCGVRCFVPYAQCLCVVTKEDVAWEIEFQSRVAAKMAKYAAMQSQQYGCEDCVCTKAGVCYNGIKKECVEIFLQTARIKVEEEMYAEG